MAGFSKTQHVYAGSDALGTELSAVVFGQHIHLTLILMIFLLGLFEGLSLQQ
jgi:hypothetical protein